MVAWYVLGILISTIIDDLQKKGPYFRSTSDLSGNPWTSTACNNCHPLKCSARSRRQAARGIADQVSRASGEEE